MNKLGQRQSQTPISSAFQVQKDFGVKKCWVEIIFCSKKMLGPKKCQYQNYLSYQKIWVQKILGPNKFWVQKQQSEKNFGKKRIFGPTKFGCENIPT